MKTRVIAPLLGPLLLLASCSEDASPTTRTAPTSVAFSIDPECDGTPETCVLEEYDAQGRETYEAADADCDGQPDAGNACRRTTYDDDGTPGNFAQVEEDADCDGVPDICTSTRFEGNGDRIGGTDEGCDGEFDGNCERWSGPNAAFHVQDDADCDGIPEHCTLLTKRDDGSVERVDDDSDCDSAPGPCGDGSTYDEEGLQTFHRTDDDCDGTPENCETQIYEGGELARESLDADCDGTPESCTEFERSGSKSVRRTDDGCDGVFDSCLVSNESKNDASFSGGIDDGCDGELDRFCFATIVDGDTRLLQYDDDCDGTPNDCSVETYVGSLLTSSADDLDCDGTADSQCYLWAKQ